MSVNRTLALAILLIFGAASHADRTVITCQKKDLLGIPVAQIVVENQRVLAAHEILRSELTGSLIQGPKLKLTSSSQAQVYNFDLGYNYTIDSTLMVDMRGAQPAVSVNQYDREDATTTSVALVCPLGLN